ncbi:uncharacterized protein LOC134715688 [Mytilus trossulus]|uniref:uncharacterized protein LOC134715688 n=1 Tax=Mytilus trossulus TaxID=6551 RepID=UPI003007BE26
MDGNNPNHLTRHGRTRPWTINGDAFNIGNRCGTRVIDSEDSDENINLLQNSQPTSEMTANTNISENAGKTQGTSSQNHSDKSPKVLILRDDIDNETLTSAYINSDSSDENISGKKEISSNEQSIAKRCKRLSSYIFVVLLNALVSVAVSVGLYNYIVCVDSTRHVLAKEPMFVNLKVNFDAYSQKVKNTSVKIPWTFQDASFLILDDNSTDITILQPGSYSVDVSLNFFNRRNNDSKPIYMCILNSLDRTYERCTPEVIPAGIQRSVTVRIDMNLKKSDIIWVNVKGANLIYERSDANHMTIRKYRF